MDVYTKTECHGVRTKTRQSVNRSPLVPAYDVQEGNESILKYPNFCLDFGEGFKLAGKLWQKYPYSWNRLKEQCRYYQERNEASSACRRKTAKAKAIEFL